MAVRGLPAVYSCTYIHTYGHVTISTEERKHLSARAAYASAARMLGNKKSLTQRGGHVPWLLLAPAVSYPEASSWIRVK